MNSVAALEPRREVRAPVLCVRDVCKSYPLYRGAGHRLAHALLGHWAGADLKSHTALEGVGFELHAGDALAVIGRNGAGKSTLLQILSGVLEPSSGSVASVGRVAGLLELGSGFNPEFTGRENIYINGAILGLSEKDTNASLGDIVAFADIGEYIDQPVKTYSSGMFLRLAFSVAIHANPELLLVDEALTVGDVFFQQKCYTKLAELRRRGMTILLVTHSMADAAEFCNRGIVLSQGRVVFNGSGKDAVEYYFHHERETPTGRRREAVTAAVDAALPSPAALTDASDVFSEYPEETIDLARVRQFGQGQVRATRMLITDRDDRPRRIFAQGGWLRLHTEFVVEETVAVPLVGAQLLNIKGVLVHSRNSLQFATQPPETVVAGTVLRCVQEIKLDVDVGEYTLEAGMAEVDALTFARRSTLPPAELMPLIRLLCHVSGVAAISVVYRTSGKPCLFSHYGVADLPGTQRLDLVAPNISSGPSAP